MNRRNEVIVWLPIMIMVLLVFQGCKNPSTPSAGYSDITSPNIGLLKVVPAGSFQRDSDSDNISVITALYRMSENEITRTQFSFVMGTDPSEENYSSGESGPVQMVTWYDAVEFCNKLSVLEGLSPVYTITNRTPNMGYPITDAAVTANWTNNGYRLPTEMEWMWAAMGAVDDYTKPFAGSNGSNVIGDYAVFGYYGSESGRTTTKQSNPVGSKWSNELGLYDMSGNVWEWTWDWSAAYPSGMISSNTAAGRGAVSGSECVIRGGGWNNDAADCTVANRDDHNPSIRDDNFGFRVVRQ